MFPRRHEQRLGRHETAASTGAGATGMVATPHRAGHRGPPRDGERVSEGGRDPGARARRAAAGVAAKTGHHTEASTDPERVKTGHHAEVSTDPARRLPPGRAPQASACEPTVS